MATNRVIRFCEIDYIEKALLDGLFTKSTLDALHDKPLVLCRLATEIENAIDNKYVVF